ncbi:MAG TPA: hypothetical protein VI078_10025 [bacterium]
MNVRATCALLVVVALLQQFVPLVQVMPVMEPRPPGGAPAFLRTLDVCDDGGDRRVTQEQPILPAQPMLAAIPSRWELGLDGPSLALPDGFPRLPLRPPRA